jgi:hypothetical protein
MKTLSKITFLIITALSILEAQAQCTPDPNLPTWGTFPDAINAAIVDVPYSQVIQYKSNIDTNLYIGAPINDTRPVKIDSLRILDVLGLPAGFSYQCHNASCMVNAGDPGCITLTGTANASQFGTYPLRVLVKTSARVDIGFWFPSSQVDTNYHYSLTIDATTGIATLNNNEDALKVFPNPAKNTVHITLPQAKNASMSITDNTGKEVYRQVVSSTTIDVNLQQFSSGLYFITVNTGLSLLQKKFSVE